jgi:hypothetical protein
VLPVLRGKKVSFHVRQTGAMAGRPRVEIDPILLWSGQSAADIAAQAGCSVRTVLDRQREEGIPIRPRGRPKGSRDRRPRTPALRDPLAAGPDWWRANWSGPAPDLGDDEEGLIAQISILNLRSRIPAGSARSGDLELEQIAHQRRPGGVCAVVGARPQLLLAAKDLQPVLSLPTGGPGQSGPHELGVALG